MKRVNIIDEFFNVQPERKFIKDLQEYEIAKIKKRLPKANQISCNGLFIEKGVFADHKNLQVVWLDFEEFTRENGIDGKTFAVYIKKDVSFGVEEFSIDVKSEYITVTAGETEGVRRAIINLEDALIKGNGNLELGFTKQKTVIKRRISRSFFAPINRPPKGANELADEMDYYPEAYLNRMMHDGVNAIWVYSDFDSLIKSSYIREFGKGNEKAIEKLNKLIEKAKRYGIDIFMFLIAPMSLDEPTIANKYPGIANKYPQVHGNSVNGPKGFCVYTEFGAGYLTEATNKLMAAAPGLAGIMSITWGERVTSCGNTWPSISGGWENNCPHCASKTRVDSITKTVELFEFGMEQINPDYDFISWTYGMRGVNDKEMEEYFQKLPEKSISMVNFEDDGRVYQLGKKRFAFDYYLCYTGPSQMYERASKYAKKYNKELYAKMQVCCSHELATVPYIPVPGIIFDKMTGAKNTGTTGVMECWFFGSYPCMMSKAVGMLSGDRNYSSKREFLIDLAKLYWAEQDFPYVVSAWEYFEKAYTAYPINVMFNYYGPMHDGIVWDLSLKPKNFGLPRTWQLTDKTDGDRIGECLFYGHTIDEAITLCEQINDNWNKGLKELSKTDEWNNKYNEQCSVAKAIGLLFNSGLNVLKFYRYRQDMGYGRQPAKNLLELMKELVYKETENSRQMIELCKLDNRLGWHSEAEGYKFHPEKLKCRIEKLNVLLNTEFLEVEQTIRNGDIPLAYYVGVEEGVTTNCVAGRNGIESAKWNSFTDGLGKTKCEFRIAQHEQYVEIELKATGDKADQNFFVTFETELMFPQNTFLFMNDGSVRLWIEGMSHQSINDEKIDEFNGFWQAKSISKDGKTHVVGRILKRDLQFTGFPIKLNVQYSGGVKWAQENQGCYTGFLGKSMCSPGEFGWVK